MIHYYTTIVQTLFLSTATMIKARRANKIRSIMQSMNLSVANVFPKYRTYFIVL